MPIFEWDEDKEKSNFRKHRIGFTEGESVFYDSHSLTIPDPDHSIEEYRFIDIGTSSGNRLLVVVYTERENRIRIISAAGRQTPNEKCMNEKTEEMRVEYDFSRGARGKHAEALRAGHETVVHKSDGSTVRRQTRPIILAPDVQAYFPDAESVHQALRGLIALVPEKRV